MKAFESANMGMMYATIINFNLSSILCSVIILRDWLFQVKEILYLES